MNPRIKDLLGVLSAILILAALILAGFEIKKRSSVDISKTRSITMSAEGKVTAKTDRASLSFSVVTQGKDAGKVQEDNDSKMKIVIDFLKSKGIADEDIKTSGYNLYPQYDYGYPVSGETRPPTISGYNLTQTVSVKVSKLEDVSSMVGGLTSKGINQIDNVSYYIDDPDALKAQAREQAINKAKQKAQDLASNLGVKLGKVINFNEGNVYLPMPYELSAPDVYGRGAGGGTSPVQPGSQDVTVNVSITFELK
ncbi:MAG: SIMPL domain-containing protein [Candidatus Doudnabacteria bacterium]|nr:SIMPL domain-containing protein [bacterium]MDZ4243496.1 SIMPL domain-containing protein [Candidatus Doudnabacteria bacterium]